MAKHAKQDGPAQHGGSTRPSVAAKAHPTKRKVSRQKHEKSKPVEQGFAEQRTAGQRPVAQASAEPKKKRSRVPLVVLAVVLVAALVGGGAYAYTYYKSISDNLHEGVTQDLEAALVKTDMANEPFYMLLMGTDGSTERDDDEDFGGSYRSDSMILTRVDPVKKKVTLLSVHRDTLVNLGDHTDKINTAYTEGGPALAVRAVSKLAGVNISHYAEVNFDAFRELVDALGGVEVDVPVDLKDPDSSYVIKAGPQVLNGSDALIMCRVRADFADVSTDPDLIRAANQRIVLSAIAKQVLASDVATIANTVRVGSEYITTDLNLNDIIGLAQLLKGLDPDTDIYTAMIPTTSEMIDGGWYEHVNEAEMKEMVRRMDAGYPPTEDGLVDGATGIPLATAGNGVVNGGIKQCTITVANGTSRDNLGEKAAKQLNDAGYVNTSVETARDTFDYPETLVIYDNAVSAKQAQLIVDALGQGKAMQNDGEYLFENDFLLVIGDDWKDQ